MARAHRRGRGERTVSRLAARRGEGNERWKGREVLEGGRGEGKGKEKVRGGVGGEGNRGERKERGKSERKEERMERERE